MSLYKMYILLVNFTFQKRIVLIFILLSTTSYTFADNWIQAYSSLNKPSYGMVTKVFSDKQIIFGGHNSSDELILFRADENGSIKSSKKIENCSFLKVILETQDKHIFISGVTPSTENEGSNIFWMKLDMNLNIIWSYQNSRTFNDVVESAIQHSNGSYYIVGYGSRSGNDLSDRDALIYNIDISGNIITSKLSSNFGTDYFNSVVELPDGNIVIAGAKLWQVAMDFYIVKYSPNLTTIISKTFGGVDNEGAYDLEISSGSIFMLGGTYSFGAGQYDALLCRLDYDLTMLFTKSYGLKSEDFPTSLVALNNELIISGNLDSIIVPDSAIAPTKSFFLKTDLSGNIINAKIFNRQSTIYSINAISAASNTEIVGVLGSTKITSSPNTAIVIFKTDSFRFKCCDYFEDITFLQSDVTANIRTQTFNFTNAGANKILTSSTINYSLDKIKSCGPLDDSAKIKVDNRPYCISELIKFSASNSITPINYIWIAGNSSTNNIKDPEFKFDTAGVYLIQYIANFDCNSDTDTVSVRVVNEIPYEVFLKKNGNCLGKPTSFFVDSSSAAITNYKWDFGVSDLNNDTSNLETPSFTYTQSGIYNVKLYTRTKCGTRVDSITINIKPLNISSIEPNAITYCKNSVVPFIFNSDATATSVLWNFGDIGNSNNTSTNSSENYIYNKPGKYICTLITNFECNSDTDTIHIYIVDHFPIDAKIKSNGYCSNEPFDFELQNNLTNETYTWEIRGPDNFTYYSKIFTHQFLRGGRYTVFASVYDNNCNLGLDTLELFVRPFIDAQIEITNDVCLAGTIFKSINFSEELLWKLSDGYTTNENVFNHSFQSTGNYTVTLITNPNSTCEDSITENISVIKENLNGGIFFPEIISPNDDGKNDIFYVENTTNNPCKIEELKIFDRWGKVMYSAEKFESFSWDGKLNGRAVIPGTYIVFLKTDLYSKSFLIHVVY